MPRALSRRFLSSLFCLGWMAGGCGAGLLVALTSSQTVTATGACENLSTLTLPNTTIVAAGGVQAGKFTAPAADAEGAAQRFNDLPAFCRVAATIRPTSDSDIKIEVWLPAAGWNGKLQAVGNGGWGGAINYGAMGDALRRGYATSSTDTGHSGGALDGRFALGHPEKVIDYAYRSEHEMTVKAKTIISAYYGEGPRLSYWNGCSSGGKQGLKEAQRYPEDFNGIVAGAPTSNWTGRAVQALWVSRAVHHDEASYMPPAKFALIHQAVLTACDALDGVRDGVLENPRRCTFDPKVLECKGLDGVECLTPAQVEAARTIYAPVIDVHTRQVIVPGHELGSELAWTTMAGPRPLGSGVDHFKYVVFQNPNWDEKTVKDSDFALAAKVDNGTINALDPNLKPYFTHGGKLLQYHGWSDATIAPGNSVTYFESVVNALGGAGNVSDSYRLFMVPGMGHCRGGDGTDVFDMLSAMERWVEKGQAPEQVLASRARDGKVNRTRPLCPYPQVAAYKGSGSTDEAANFVCKVLP